MGGRRKDRRRQGSEFQASLVYRVIPKTTRTTQRNPASEKNNKTKHPTTNNKKERKARVSGAVLYSKVLEAEARGLRI